MALNQELPRKKKKKFFRENNRRKIIARDLKFVLFW